MKTSLLKLLVVISLSAFLPSCATKLSQSQKSKITSIHIPPATTQRDAYTKPNFTSSDDAAMAGGISGGLGFGLVGGIISEVVVAAESANDARKNKASTDAIAKNVPQDLDRILTEQLLTKMQQDSFFGPRLTKQPVAPAQLRVTITHYSLHSLDDVNFAPVVSAEVVLMIGGNPVRKKSMRYPSGLNQTWATVSRAPLTAYATNVDLLRSHFEASTRQLADLIAADLAKAAAP